MRWMICLLVIVVIVAVILTFQSGELESLILRYVQIYGYYAIFGMAFVLDMLWQPIGPEAPISIAILFGLNAFYVFILILLGSYIASLLNYFLGKTYLSEKLMLSLSPDERKKYTELFRKYGKWGLFVAAIGPIPWVLFCWLAGSFQMKFRKFFLYGLFPRFLRILIVVLLVRHLNLVLM